MPPADFDFGFTIDFKKGEGDPRRVFDAASALISGFELLDDALVDSIDSRIDPVMVLEDVEAGSIRVWLKNILKKVDDEALKDLDWKKQVGSYLVKAKYLVIEFLDEDEAPNRTALENLKDGLQRLATDTDVRHLPDYPPIHDARLLSALDRLQKAKSELGPNDRLIIETADKTYEVNLSSQWKPSSNILPVNTTTTETRGEIILTIRKPDFIKDTMWQFSHGKASIAAPIKDEEWLSSFHSRGVTLLPGDALKCIAVFIHTYDDKGALVDSTTVIEKVLDIIGGDGFQRDLLK